MPENILNAGANLARTEQTRLQRQQINQERLQRIARHKQAIAAHKLARAAAPEAARL
jgi:flagellar biosynthesis/type III secretory pathway chaperone